MLNVTLNFAVYCVILVFSGCVEHTEKPPPQEIQHYNDSIAEVRIDSAYREIRSACDTLLVYQVPKMVDSLLKDSGLLRVFFNTGNLYSDADKKVEKVIWQLQADCDSNLLRETYRRARLRQKLKPAQHKK